MARARQQLLGPHLRKPNWVGRREYLVVAEQHPDTGPDGPSERPQ